MKCVEDLQKKLGEHDPLLKLLHVKLSALHITCCYIPYDSIELENADVLLENEKRY